MIALLALAYAKTPVILVPPMFGSTLYANIHNLKSHWYCKKNIKDHWIWISDKYLVPPLTGCLGEYLIMVWNESGKHPQSRPEADIYTIDFGGDKAIEYIDTGIFGKHIIPDLVHLIKRLEKGGYIMHKDMFGAPYDWRQNPVYLDPYFEQLTQLVEEAYNTNNNEKVAIYGISAGSFAIQSFLASKEQEWKDKYIKKVIFHGPSFGGAVDVVAAFFSSTIHFLPSIFNVESVKKLVRTIPTLSGHFPNHGVFGNRVVVYDNDGKTYTASQMPEFMEKKGTFTTEDIKQIFFAGQKYASSHLKESGVPSYFLFNSVLQTPASLRIDSKNKFSLNQDLGDGTILKDALYYGCTQWKQEQATVCHDLKINNTDYNHASQLVRDDVQDLIFDIIQDDTWIVKGIHNITGKYDRTKAFFTRQLPRQ